MKQYTVHVWDEDDERRVVAQGEQFPGKSASDLWIMSIFGCGEVYLRPQQEGTMRLLAWSAGLLTTSEESPLVNAWEALEDALYLRFSGQRAESEYDRFVHLMTCFCEHAVDELMNPGSHEFLTRLVTMYNKGGYIRIEVKKQPEENKS